MDNGQNFFESSMIDTSLLWIHELEDLVTKIYELKVEISLSFQVGTIIAKLPPTWNNCMKKLEHKREDKPNLMIKRIFLIILSILIAYKMAGLNFRRTSKLITIRISRN